MIFEAGRMAPTGTNAQGTSFVLLDAKKDECEAIAAGMFSKLMKTGKKLTSKLSNMEIDKKPKAVITLVIGYPAVKYHRTPHRNPLNLKRL